MHASNRTLQVSQYYYYEHRLPPSSNKSEFNYIIKSNLVQSRESSLITRRLGERAFLPRWHQPPITKHILILRAGLSPRKVIALCLIFDLAGTCFQNNVISRQIDEHANPAYGRHISHAYEFQEAQARWHVPSRDNNSQFSRRPLPDARSWTVKSC